MTFLYGTWRKKLCRRWTCRLNPTVEASEGVRSPHRPIWPGQLRKNTRKTVSTACQPCHTSGSMSVETYKSRMMGTGPIFWERQRRVMNCPECGVEVVVGPLITHHQIQHNMGHGDLGGGPPPGRPKLTGYLYRNVCCGSGSQ